ncbi:MAG: FadR/GntR family transcriptional regulator [Sphingomonadaceae bacterium]
MPAVRAAATYELVVDQIRRAIYLGRFLPGDKLPPERDLANQMGISRTTIREAIRLLEGEGLLEIRRGATGGLIVRERARLSKREAQAHVANQCQLIDHIFDFRLATECAAAALAAKRHTDPQRRMMRKLLDEMTELTATAEDRQRVANIAKFTARDSAFHLAIATASLNPFLIKAVEEGRAEMFERIGRVFNRIEERSDQYYEELFDAIAGRNAAAASDSMRKHLEASRQSIHDMLPLSKRPTRAAA